MSFRTWSRRALTVGTLGLALSMGIVPVRGSGLAAIDALNVGRYHLASGDESKALEAFSEAIRENPQFVPAYLARGKLYAAQGQYDSALADLSFVVRVQPMHAEALQCRGFCRFAQGDHDAALKDLDAALKVDPRAARAYHIKAQVLMARGDAAGAEQHFAAALRLDPWVDSDASLRPKAPATDVVASPAAPVEAATGPKDTVAAETVATETVAAPAPSAVPLGPLGSEVVRLASRPSQDLSFTDAPAPAALDGPLPRVTLGATAPVAAPQAMPVAPLPAAEIAGPVSRSPVVLTPEVIALPPQPNVAVPGPAPVEPLAQSAAVEPPPAVSPAPVPLVDPLAVSAAQPEPPVELAEPPLPETSSSPFSSSASIPRVALESAPVVPTAPSFLSEARPNEAGSAQAGSASLPGGWIFRRLDGDAPPAVSLGQVSPLQGEPLAPTDPLLAALHEAKTLDTAPPTETSPGHAGMAQVSDAPTSAMASDAPLATDGLVTVDDAQWTPAPLPTVSDELATDAPPAAAPAPAPAEPPMAQSTVVEQPRSRHTLEARNLLVRGVALAARGDLPGAVKLYDQALALDPQLIEALRRRSAARVELGQLDAARSDLEQAIAAAPGFGQLYCDRGQLALRRGDLASALDDMDTALRLDASLARAHLGRSFALEARGEAAAAAEARAQAVALDPALIGETSPVPASARVAAPAALPTVSAESGELRMVRAPGAASGAAPRPAVRLGLPAAADADPANSPSGVIQVSDE